MSNQINVLIQATDKASGVFKKISGETKALASEFTSLQNIAIAGIGGLTLGGLGKGILDLQSSFEQLKVSLKTITGSSFQAEEALKWVSDFSAKTPYQLDQVSKAFITLKAYGLDAISLLPMLGDTASALGKTLDEAVQMIADSATMEFERLKEFGIRVQQEQDKLIFRWSENGQDMIKVTEKTQKAISQMLADIFSKYKGGMLDQSKTFSGMISTLTDQIKIFALEASDKVFLRLESRLTDLMAKIEKASKDGTLDQWADRISESLEKLYDSTELFIKSGGLEVLVSIGKVFFAVWSVNKLLDLANMIKRIGTFLKVDLALGAVFAALKVKDIALAFRVLAFNLGPIALGGGLIWAFIKALQIMRGEADKAKKALDNLAMAKTLSSQEMYQQSKTPLATILEMPFDQVQNRVKVLQAVLNDSDSKLKAMRKEYSLNTKGFNEIGVMPIPYRAELTKYNDTIKTLNQYKTALTSLRLKKDDYRRQEEVDPSLANPKTSNNSTMNFTLPRLDLSSSKSLSSYNEAKEKEKQLLEEKVRTISQVSSRVKELTLSEYDYQRYLLSEEYKEYQSTLGKKAFLDNWYQLELKKIKEEESRAQKEALEETMREKREAEEKEFNNKLKLDEALAIINRTSHENIEATIRSSVEERIRFYQEKFQDEKALGEDKLHYAQELANAMNDLESLVPRSSQEAWERGLKSTLNQMGDFKSQAEEIAKQMADNMQRSLSDLFFDALTFKLKNLGDYIESFIQSIARSFSNLLANQMTTRLLSKFFNLDSSITDFKEFTQLEFRANGGPVKKGRKYIVGEKGPELLEMGADGFITPNNLISQGSGNLVAMSSTRPEVIVNVINQSGSKLQARQETRVIDEQRIIVDLFLDAYMRDINGLQTFLKGGRG